MVFVRKPVPQGRWRAVVRVCGQTESVNHARSVRMSVPQVFGEYVVRNLGQTRLTEMTFVREPVPHGGTWSVFPDKQSERESFV